MTRRGIALALLGCVILTACGHYGPPVRSKPESGDATPYDASKRDRDSKQGSHQR
jgi:hypothetical protein